MMRCSVCSHDEKDAIDAAVIAGASYRDVAARFGIATSSLGRHVKNHLVKTLAAARDAERVANGDDLLDQVADLRRQAQEVTDKAFAASDLRTVLAGIRELTRIVELLARLRGELNDKPTVNVLLSPRWVEVRGVILDALTPYPDARAAAAAALLRLDNDGRGA
jgi:transposase-like protein